MNRIWSDPATPPAMFAVEDHIPRALLAILWNRGFRTREAIHRYLYEEYPDGIHDPYLLTDMHDAVSLIFQAIARQMPILIYGDYDTDGVTSAELMRRVLVALGSDVRLFVPHRLRDGYGLHAHVIDSIYQEYGSDVLIVTVDCGTSNAKEVEHAQGLGISIIVTDHHLPKDGLPRCTVVNPNRPGDPYPDKSLAGVGVAFKLASALILRLDQYPPPISGRHLLDLVALGTVTDVAPLTGENRVLVRKGIEALRKTTHAGIRALIEVSRVTQHDLRAADIAWKLGPRLNAAGRMDDAILALNLLGELNPDQAISLAQRLDAHNADRQDQTRLHMEAAEAQADTPSKVIIVSGPSFPAGIVGQIAGKLAEKYYKPTFVLVDSDDRLHGSARSIPGVHLLDDLLEPTSQLYTRYGGHAMAAGLEMPKSRFPEFRIRMTQLSQFFDIQPHVRVDAIVVLSELTWDLLTMLRRMDPCGAGNPDPHLVVHGILPMAIRTRGAQGQHLSFSAMSATGLRSNSIPCIWFGHGDWASDLRQKSRIDLVGVLEDNVWNGESTLQLRILDIH